MRLLAVAIVAGFVAATPTVAEPAATTTTTATASNAGPTAADPMSQMVCRKSLETGSLVKARKTCHTRRQWAYLDDAGQGAGRDLVDDGRSHGSVGN